MDKKGQNEQDLASPVIAALQRGITGLCVGNVQVNSELNPNLLAAIRTTSYVNRRTHSQPRTSSPCLGPLRILYRGRQKARERP